jgi:hypothetical protein
MLFHGETRSGKTNAINGLITQLHEQAAQGMPLRLYAGDLKGEINRVWSTSPLFPEGVATTPNEIAETIAELVHDRTMGLQARSRLFDQAAMQDGKLKHVITNIEDYERVTKQPLERVFIVVDEINALMLEASKSNRLKESMMQLLQMGAGSGFYLLAGAQHLTAATLGTEGKYNFTTRAHFGDFNTTAITMLFGKVNADALKPHMTGAKGRGVIKTVGRSDPYVFQSLYCEHADILKAIELVSGGVPSPVCAASEPAMLLEKHQDAPGKHQKHQCSEDSQNDQNGQGENTGGAGVPYTLEQLRNMHAAKVSINQALAVYGIAKGSKNVKYQAFRAAWKEANGE